MVVRHVFSRSTARSRGRRCAGREGEEVTINAVNRLKGGYVRSTGTASCFPDGRRAADGDFQGIKPGARPSPYRFKVRGHLLVLLFLLHSHSAARSRRDVCPIVIDGERQALHKVAW